MTQDTPAAFPARILAVIREMADRKGTATHGPWQDSEGLPLQDDADAALRWIAQAATSAAGGATEDERIALIELNAAANVRRRLWDVVREVRPDLAAGNIGSPATLDGLLRDALPRYVPTPYDDSPQFVEVSEGAALAAQSPDSGAGPAKEALMARAWTGQAVEVCPDCDIADCKHIRAQRAALAQRGARMADAPLTGYWRDDQVLRFARWVVNHQHPPGRTMEANLQAFRENQAARGFDVPAVTQPQPPAAPLAPITEAIQRDDSGDAPAFCVMVAFRSEREALKAMGRITGALTQAADAGAAEPVAWRWKPSHIFNEMVVTDDKVKADSARHHGMVVDDLYLAPPAQQLQQAVARELEPIKQAIRDCHYALDTRQHGGIAAGKAVDAISEALGMHWKQGEEAAIRQQGTP